MKFIYTITSQDGRTAVIDSGEIPHFEAEFDFIPTGDPEICKDINSFLPQVLEEDVYLGNHAAHSLQIALRKLGYTFSRKVEGKVVYPPGDIRF